ncbi:hypothetical protein AMTR_s00019p00227930 [Amborella trichopoda]|uniref:Tyrosine-protein kinase catalytic domain-containing protein n=1 Tax=Amborella trichopoda TaxID=13333 RepID=W1PJQ2_AMBTC|nr:hypothetical protein AMTR_s00019p00227930 [Amborella trichopoda]
MEKLKPMRFSAQQLNTATENLAHMLGAGGYGAVYKDTFPNGAKVAVKVLKGSSDQRIEALSWQSMRALVYEFMENGSLDGFLFRNTEKISFDKLHETNEIALGTAKGIAYLHEDCQQRGMLLFEIVRRRKNLEVSLPQSQEWFPTWVWNMLERGKMEDMMQRCEIEENRVRMVMVALWCVQYRPEQRACMSNAVKIL